MAQSLLLLVWLIIKKISDRDENIRIGTWNMRTLIPAGKLEELTHTMGRYPWNILEFCEMP